LSRCQEDFDIALDSRKCLTVPLMGQGAGASGQQSSGDGAGAGIAPGKHRSPLAALTRAESVYAQLRADILSGRILPGS
jgi:hypothetical protein